MGSTNTESRKFNANLVLPHHTKPISVFWAGRIYLCCCVFLFCPLKEIPEAALRRVMPQLPPPCFSSCWHGEEASHAPFFSVIQCLCCYTLGVCEVCVCALSESSDFTWICDVWANKRCMCAHWCVYLSLHLVSQFPNAKTFSKCTYMPQPLCACLLYLSVP